MGRCKEIYTEAMIEARGDESRICWKKDGSYIIMPSSKMIRGFSQLMNPDL